MPARRRRRLVLDAPQSWRMRWQDGVAGTNHDIAGSRPGPLEQLTAWYHELGLGGCSALRHLGVEFARGGRQAVGQPLHRHGLVRGGADRCDHRGDAFGDLAADVGGRSE